MLLIFTGCTPFIMIKYDQHVFTLLLHSAIYAQQHTDQLRNQHNMLQESKSTPIGQLTLFLLYFSFLPFLI